MTGCCTDDAFTSVTLAEARAHPEQVDPRLRGDGRKCCPAFARRSSGASLAMAYTELTSRSGLLAVETGAGWAEHVG
jgi:hypothetical protein